MWVFIFHGHCWSVPLSFIGWPRTGWASRTSRPSWPKRASRGHRERWPPWNARSARELQFGSICFKGWEQGWSGVRRGHKEVCRKWGNWKYPSRQGTANRILPHGSIQGNPYEPQRETWRRQLNWFSGKPQEVYDWVCLISLGPWVL